MKLRSSIAAVGAAATLVGGGTLLALPAFAGGGTHTLTFDSVTKSQSHLGKTAGVSFDKDLNTAHKVIGYDVLTWEGQSHADVALALKDGFIYAHLAFTKTGAVTGKLTGGSGKYAGATGTVKGTSVSKTKTEVTVTYKL